MIKRISAIFLSVVVLGVLFSVFAVNTASAVTSDIATLTFDTESAIPFFYDEGDLNVTLSITEEYAYTGRSLKVTLGVPDARVHEARLLMDAGKLRLPNFNNCTIEAHVFFPVPSDKIWGPSTQSVTIIATDPSWREEKSDSSIFGTWQTITLENGANDNNKSFGFFLPIASGNAGEVVCYIDDIRIIKDGAVLESVDYDANLVYPLPTDTATNGTTQLVTEPSDSDDTTEEVTTTTPVPDPDEQPRSSPLVIVLIVSLLIVAAIAGIIYFFVWKSKNKYY